MSSNKDMSKGNGRNLKSVKRNNNNMNKNKNPPKKNGGRARRNRNNRGVTKNKQNGNSGPVNSRVPFGYKDSKIVSNREQFTTVNGTVGFNSILFSLNPAQVGSFPWLSKEALQYEKYRWRKMCFYYTPQVNEFATNNNGTILLSVDTDALDPAPVDLQHALDTRPNSKGMLPAREFSFDVPTKYLNRMSDGYYCRPGNLPGGADMKTYDCANLFLNTTGNVNTNLCGFITVEYEIEFFIPILDSENVAPQNNVVALFRSTTDEGIVASGVVQNLLLATSVANGLSVVNTSGSFVIPTGLYMIDVECHAVSAGAIMSAFTLDIEKNGTTVHSVLPQIDPLSNNAVMTLPWFITSNGTDAYTFPVSVTFAAGTSDVDAILRITAI